MNARKPEERDLLSEWLELSRKVLAKYYPDAVYGMLLIHQGPDLPDVNFPVTLPVPASACAPVAPVSGR